MTRYAILSGNSGVTAFQLGDNSIIVEFNFKSAYLYDVLSTGREAIDMMMKLALAGKGLNSFINKKVKKNYRSKLR